MLWQPSRDLEQLLQFCSLLLLSLLLLLASLVSCRPARLTTDSLADSQWAPSHSREMINQPSTRIVCPNACLHAHYLPAWTLDTLQSAVAFLPVTNLNCPSTINQTPQMSAGASSPVCVDVVSPGPDVLDWHPLHRPLEMMNHRRLETTTHLCCCCCCFRGLSAHCESVPATSRPTRLD